MANYLIEFRVQGYAKRYCRDLMTDLSKKFRLSKRCFSGGGVPHITLYGPFNTKDEKRLVSTFHSLCKKYNRIYFTFKGFERFNNPDNKVIYLDISPSEDLKQFRYSLASELRQITQTISREDRRKPDEFVFHTTLAFKGIDNQFNNIWSYLLNKEQPKIRQTLLRITILKNSRILCEYDFMQRRLLTRSQALNKQMFRRTIEILKQQPRPTQEPEKESPQIEQHLTIWDKLSMFFRGK